MYWPSEMTATDHFGMEFQWVSFMREKHLKVNSAFITERLLYRWLKVFCITKRGLDKTQGALNRPLKARIERHWGHRKRIRLYSFISNQKDTTHIISGYVHRQFRDLICSLICSLTWSLCRQRRNYAHKPLLLSSFFQFPFIISSKFLIEKDRILKRQLLSRWSSVYRPLHM